MFLMGSAQLIRSFLSKETGPILIPSTHFPHIIIFQLGMQITCHISIFLKMVQVACQEEQLPYL